MPVERVTDDSGDTMTLIRYNQDRFGASDFVENSLLNMKDVELREDDIMLCSYSKSGCHWMWEVLRMLQTGSTTIDVIEKEDYMLEYNTLEEIAERPSPRVLNNHMPWDSQPRDLIEKKVKVVFFYRNLKDVAVSFFHHHRKFKDYEYTGSFDNYLKRLVQGKVDNGSPFKYLKEWEEAIINHPELPIFVGCYEDMKERPLPELRRLTRFLGFTYNDNFLRDVINMTSFDTMKMRKGPVSFHDDRGQPIMYRKGQVGDWRNHFTKEQSDWFDEIARQELSGSRLRFRYTLEDWVPEPCDIVNYNRHTLRRHSVCPAGFGQLGDWRKHFTKEQGQRFEEIVRQQLARSRMQLRCALEDPFGENKDFGVNYGRHMMRRHSAGIA